MNSENIQKGYITKCKFFKQVKEKYCVYKKLVCICWEWRMKEEIRGKKEEIRGKKEEIKGKKEEIKGKKGRSVKKFL